MKNLALILIIIFLLGGCEQPTEFIRDNSKDPSYPNFHPDPLSNIQLDITDNFALLSWDRGSIFNQKYQIVKTDTDNTIILEDTVNNTTSYKDTSASPFHGYYQINQITDHDVLIQNENPISFDYGISNFQTSYIDTKDKVLLEWKYNGYFDTNFIIERTIKNGAQKELAKLSGTPYLYEDGEFSYNNIGLNTYEIYPQTSFGNGKVLSKSIRLPQWGLLQKLPTDINLAHLVSIGSSIYVISAQFTNYRYDTLSNTWSEIAGNSGKFHSYQFIAQPLTNNKILVLNGEFYELYDINQDKWSSSSDVPYPWILGFASVQINEEFVLLTGGDDEPSGSYEPNRETYLFNIQTNTWSQSTDMTNPRSFHLLIKVEQGKAIAMGGLRNGQKVELFDFSTKKWTPLPDSPIYPRRAVQLENDYVLVLSKDQSVLFNPTTLSWSDPINFAENQFAHDEINDLSLVSLPNNNALVMGLTGSERGKSSQIFRFNEKDWVQIGNSLNTRIRSFPFLTSEKKIILIGGAGYDGRDTYEFLEMVKFLND